MQGRVADEIDVSRTPVREALPHLAREGIPVRAGAFGFTVRDVSKRKVRDVYQAHETIEGCPAKIPTAHMPPANVDC